MLFNVNLYGTNSDLKSDTKLSMVDYKALFVGGIVPS